MVFPMVTAQPWVGVIGGTPQETFSISRPSAIAGLYFKNPAKVFSGSGETILPTLKDVY